MHCNGGMYYNVLQCAMYCNAIMEICITMYYNVLCIVMRICITMCCVL